MDKKYWVPALEKAHSVLRAIAEEPNRLRLIDLSKRLGINKSSMFSLLATMEALQWVERDKADTYALGPVHSLWGSSYFRQYDLIAIFHREAAVAKSIVGETIQLAKLEGNEVLYLAKEEAPTPVRLASDPGMKFPAHATALGKALLSGLQDETLHELYPGEALAGLTPYTLRTKEELFEQLRTVSRNGYATDVQEAVVGFCCVAAPVIDRSGKAVAAVSCSMPLHQWERKEEIAKREIIALAQRLSFH